MISAQDLVDRIQKNVGVPWQSQRGDGFSDGILAGDPKTPIRGVATTFTPSLECLRRAVSSGKNTIICRESPFYSRGERAPVGWRNGPAPEKEQLEHDDIYRAKRDFISQNGLVIIRLVENWDSRDSDGQLRGLAHALEWEGMHTASKSGTDEYDTQNVYFQLPTTALGHLATDIKRKLKIQSPRVVGDPAATVSKVALVHGLLLVAEAQRILKSPGVDVVIAGDAVEWEAVPFFQDLVTAGMTRGLILVGQEASEEPGSNEMAMWLRGFVNEVPIEWIPAGEPFRALTSERK